MFKAVVVLALAACVLADVKCFTPYVPCPAHIKMSVGGSVMQEQWAMQKGLEGAQKQYTPLAKTTTLMRTDIKDKEGKNYIYVSRSPDLLSSGNETCTEMWLPVPTPASGSVPPVPSDYCDGMEYDNDPEKVDCPDGSKGDCKKYCKGSSCFLVDKKDRIVQISESGVDVVMEYLDCKMEDFTIEPCEGGDQRVKEAPKETCAASFAKVALLALVALFAALL